jgi:hypothetical protein
MPPKAINTTHIPSIVLQLRRHAGIPSRNREANATTPPERCHGTTGGTSFLAVVLAVVEILIVEVALDVDEVKVTLVGLRVQPGL